MALHRILGTWRRVVGAYIALSDFSRGKFIKGGLPPEKIFVEPNFLTCDRGMGAHTGNFGLYVGRISPEKGLGVLQKAWELIGEQCRLKILGGPIPNERSQSSSIEWLGISPRSGCFRK